MMYSSDHRDVDFTVEHHFLKTASAGQPVWTHFFFFFFLYTFDKVSTKKLGEKREMELLFQSCFFFFFIFFTILFLRRNSPLSLQERDT